MSHRKVEDVARWEYSGDIAIISVQGSRTIKKSEVRFTQNATCAASMKSSIFWRNQVKYDISSRPSLVCKPPNIVRHSPSRSPTAAKAVAIIDRASDSCIPIYMR